MSIGVSADVGCTEAAEYDLNVLNLNFSTRCRATPLLFLACLGSSPYFTSVLPIS